MSPVTPVNVKITLRNSSTSPTYQNSPNTEGPYVEISQPQPDVELTQKTTSIVTYLFTFTSKTQESH